MAANDSDFNYAIVEKFGMKFVISRTPANETLPRFIKLWDDEGVKNVVRICSPSMYETDSLKEHGISVHEMEFKDGTSPPPELIDRWLLLVETVFPRKGSASPEMGTAIGVHCIAGLGRAPMMVAIALIERGMPYLKAVDFLRTKRPKCINEPQLAFLRTYKPRHKGCLIM